MKRLLLAISAVLVINTSAMATTVTCWFPKTGAPNDRVEKIEFFSVRAFSASTPGVLRFIASNGLRHVIVNIPCDVTE